MRKTRRRVVKKGVRIGERDVSDERARVEEREVRTKENVLDRRTRERRE
jgi:hypothetical protein